MQIGEKRTRGLGGKTSGNALRLFIRIPWKSRYKILRFEKPIHDTTEPLNHPPVLRHCLVIVMGSMVHTELVL
jgi:hypothetical protein